MKRLMILFTAACLISVCLLTGCEPLNKKESDKLQIVATLFPQYDFARTLAADLADITLLLPPGAESHSYEPTPADMILINNADLFIYTGDAMEGWVASVLSGLEGNPAVLDISEGLDLHDASHDESAGHTHDVDPHVFTSLRRARQMAQKLEDTLCSIDSENSGVYQSRGAWLREELTALDEEMQSVTQSAVRNKLIFGGRFAFGYFVEDYALSYDSAFDSCSSEAEPAAADVARLIDEVRSENIPVVYYEELSNPKTAQLICDETGAKPLLLHSCHNISKEELETGQTYLSLMQMNIEHLREGLCQ